MSLCYMSPLGLRGFIAACSNPVGWTTGAVKPRTTHSNCFAAIEVNLIDFEYARYSDLVKGVSAIGLLVAVHILLASGHWLRGRT